MVVIAVNLRAYPYSLSYEVFGAALDKSVQWPWRRSVVDLTLERSLKEPSVLRSKHHHRSACLECLYCGSLFRKQKLDLHKTKRFEGYAGGLRLGRFSVCPPNAALAFFSDLVAQRRYGETYLNTALPPDLRGRVVEEVQVLAASPPALRGGLGFGVPNHDHQGAYCSIY